MSNVTPLNNTNTLFYVDEGDGWISIKWEMGKKHQTVRLHGQEIERLTDLLIARRNAMPDTH